MRRLTTEDLAERYRTSESTIRYWRMIGKGPRGIRYGRRVLYDEAECDRWDNEQAAEQDGGAAA